MQPRIALTLLIAVAIALASVESAPVRAHTVSSSGQTYRTEALCVERRASLGHSSNSKETASETRSLTRMWSPDFGYIWCGKTFTRPAGWIRTTSALMKSNGDGTWAVCRYHDWRYNAVETYVAHRHVIWGTACGAGTYRAWGNGGVYHNDAWRGAGTMQTGSHGFSG